MRLVAWRESWQVGEDLEMRASLYVVQDRRVRRPAWCPGQPMLLPGQPMATGKVGPGKRLENGPTLLLSVDIQYILRIGLSFLAFYKVNKVCLRNIDGSRCGLK